MSPREAAEKLALASFDTMHTADICCVEVVEVVELTFTRGLGIDGDPIRTVTQYWTRAGQFIGEFSAGVLTEKGKG